MSTRKFTGWPPIEKVTIRLFGGARPLLFFQRQDGKWLRGHLFPLGAFTFPVSIPCSKHMGPFVGAFSFTWGRLVQDWECQEHTVLPQWPDIFTFISKSSLLSLLTNTFWDISNNFDLFFFPENLSIFWIFLHTAVVTWVTKAVSHLEDCWVLWIYRGIWYRSI